MLTDQASWQVPMATVGSLLVSIALSMIGRLGAMAVPMVGRQLVLVAVPTVGRWPVAVPTVGRWLDAVPTVGTWLKR